MARAVKGFHSFNCMHTDVFIRERHETCIGWSSFYRPRAERRLSSLSWPVIYLNELPKRRRMVTHPCTNRARRWLTRWIDQHANQRKANTGCPNLSPNSTLYDLLWICTVRLCARQFLQRMMLFHVAATCCTVNDILSARRAIHYWRLGIWFYIH